MKLLLALLLVGCAPDRATVSKVAHVAVSGSSFETGKPMSDPETVSLARGYLHAARRIAVAGRPDIAGAQQRRRGTGDRGRAASKHEPALPRSAVGTGGRFAGEVILTLHARREI